MSRANQFINYDRIVRSISADTGVSKKEASEMCNIVTNTIKKLLLCGCEVYIPHMGTLIPRFHRGRGRWVNPYDKTVSESKDSFKLRFRPTRLFESSLTESLLYDKFDKVINKVFHHQSSRSLPGKLNIALDNMTGDTTHDLTDDELIKYLENIDER